MFNMTYPNAIHLPRIRITSTAIKIEMESECDDKWQSGNSICVFLIVKTHVDLKRKNGENIHYILRLNTWGPASVRLMIHWVRQSVCGDALLSIYSGAVIGLECWSRVRQKAHPIRGVCFYFMKRYITKRLVSRALFV